MSQAGGERRFFHERRRAVWTSAALHGALGVAPIIGTVLLVRIYHASGGLALDFENSMWLAAHRVLQGASPYIAAHSPLVATGEPFVYPAPAAMIAVPFALLPQAVAGGLFVGVCIVSVLAALYVLGVRDWRVFGVVMLWPAVVSGWQSANVTLPMVLGISLCWRYRDRPAVVGLLVGLLASIKVFVWPLELWLIATRRRSAAAQALGWGLALNLVSWAVIGFDQIPRYRELLASLTRLRGPYSYNIVALAEHDGLSRTGAYALAAIPAVAVAVACVYAGRRGRDVTCFAACIILALLSTPLIWLHYYALLLVPLALVRPRLGPLWALPLVLWVSVAHADGWPGSWTVVAALLLIATVLAVAFQRKRVRGDAPPLRRRAAGPRDLPLC